MNLAKMKSAAVEVGVRPDVRLADGWLLLRSEDRKVDMVSPGGLVLADSEQANAVHVVAARGQGVRLDDGTRKETGIKEGDRVVFVNDAPVIYVGGRPYKMCQEYQVVAVLGAAETASVRDQALLPTR